MNLRETNEFLFDAVVHLHEGKERIYKITPDKVYNKRSPDSSFEGWNVKYGRKIRSQIRKDTKGYWVKAGLNYGPYDTLDIAVKRVAYNLESSFGMFGDEHNVRIVKKGNNLTIVVDGFE